MSRLNEYVNYHINGDCDCNAVLLKAYSKEHKLTAQQVFDLCYFFSITYAVPTAIILLEDKELILKDIDTYVAKNKEHLFFQSDRKYVKILDRFNNCLKFYKNNLTDSNKVLETFVVNNEIDIGKAIRIIQKWYYFGRCSAFLFIETLCTLTGYKIKNYTIDWQNGDTATSGLMNVFGYDESANYFDKHNKLPINLDKHTLDQMLLNVMREIKRKGGNDNVTYIETSLCGYRKHFKGTRYNGYYLDRQLEEINFYKNDSKRKSLICDLTHLRCTIFDKSMLGEVNHWDGIRKQLKTAYLDGKGML